MAKTTRKFLIDFTTAAIVKQDSKCVILIYVYVYIYIYIYNINIVYIYIVESAIEL